MNKSATIASLAEALSKAQAEFPPVPMNATNPFLKNKYADLGAVIETAKPILAKYGLSVIQFPVSGTNVHGLPQVGVTTTLLHQSGEFFEDTITVPLEAGKGLSENQAAGVSITYLRRYALASVLGLYADEDLDASVAHVNQEVKKVMQRIWSIDQMEAVISVGGLASTHEEAQTVLNASNLPENAPVKTVQSWLKYFSNAGKDSLEESAAVANSVYTNHKKGAK